MSLLTACQAVIKETGIGSAPATIISNADLTAVQLNYLAERAVKKLAKKNWEKLLREHTITTAASTEGYALPTDWARYVSQTAWDATNYWPMYGSIDPAMWQGLKRGIVASSIRRRFRIRGGQVLITPTPTTVDTLIIEYARNTPWTDSTGVTYKTAATADADITVFPEHLLELEIKWRFLRAKSLSYDEEFEEAKSEIALAFAQDAPAPTLNFGQRTESTPTFLANIPQEI